MREKIAELADAMKRDAGIAQKARDDYSATKLLNAADLLVEAESWISTAAHWYRHSLYRKWEDVR